MKARRWLANHGLSTNLTSKEPRLPSQAGAKQLWSSVSGEPTGPENETASEEIRTMIEETEDEVAVDPETDIDLRGLMMNVAQRLSIKNRKNGKSAKKKQRHT